MKTTTIALSALSGLAILGVGYTSGCTSDAYTPSGQTSHLGSGGTGTGGAAGTTSSGGAGGGGGTATTTIGGGGASGSTAVGGSGPGTGGASGGGGTTRAGGTSGSVGGSGSGGTSAGGAGGTGTGGGGSTSPAACTDGKTPAGVACITWGSPAAGAPTGTGSTATVTVDTSRTVGTIGDDFNGFSYEKTQMTNASLTAANKELIALHKLLGKPLTRIGANDVDNCTWGGTGPAPTTPSGAPFTKSIKTGMVDSLCEFLAQTGTKVIYGVNYSRNDVAASTAEATYVMSKCPSSVYSFEIGNEIEKYGSWTAQQARYERFADAILAIPGTVLVGPAATDGSYSSLTVPYIRTQAAKYGNKIVAATQHLYVAGSGTTGATLAALQTTTNKFTNIINAVNPVVVQYKLPRAWRFGELNTFSQHGQPGVSDTLIEGLWAIDVLFTIAKGGCSGLNFHGGETGMDGTRPFTYQPIQMVNGRVTQVQPEFHGMLLFTLAGQGKMVGTTVTTTNANFTGYALKADDGFVSVVLINRNASSGVNATVNMGAAASSASAIYLQGKTAGLLTEVARNVTLAGATVAAAGTWRPDPPYTLTPSGNTVAVHVPAASAVLVHVVM